MCIRDRPYPGSNTCKKIREFCGQCGLRRRLCPPLKNTTDALDALMGAIEEAGYNKKITIGLDSAATEFYKDGKYKVDGKKLSSEELIDFYSDLVKTYPILSIEDPFEEESFEDFAELTRKLKDTII